MRPEVEWVLNQLGGVVDAQPADHPLRRVDRDASQLYEGSSTVDMSTPIDDRTGDLQEANFVGARFADRSDSPIGTEFDLDAERVVGLRIEGYSGSFGHVDPQGTDGVVFSDLVDQITSALYDGRKSPAAGGPDVAFTHLLLTNHAPQSAQWADYHRYDVDVVLNGFAELP